LRVTIRVDASPLIGGGHAMRCVTLANALAERGAGVIFVTAVIPDAMADRITGRGHSLVRIPASTELEREGEDWHEGVLSADAQDADVRATGEATGISDWLVVDHYLLDARWHSASRRFAERILVVDDLANRQYDCDVLLDQNFGRSAADYRRHVPPHAKVLAGATYALLRPEFARERPAALERRHACATAKRILISLGTTDPDGLAAKIARQVLDAAPSCALDVVLGPQAASLAELQELAREDSRVTVHVDSNRMAQLMRDADIGIGASGATSWERCCLGLPTLTLILAGNQRPTADALQRAGAVAVVTSDHLQRGLREWLTDDAERGRVSERSAAICDGLGTSRVTSAMLDMETPHVG
jgi:UDP-2,4-diacetamido-2,4,6-trideoxy-beta-L-altropyranose hydrolase